MKIQTALVLAAFGLSSGWAAAKEKAEGENKMEAKGNDTSDGCGLGWQVTNKKTMVATTTRATTNNFVPPAFGMTSGTLGCEQHSFAQIEQDALDYANVNQEVLKLEMAQGEGEFLRGLADVMGCDAATFAAFSSTLRANYTAIAPPSASGTELYRNVKAALSREAVLAQSCGLLLAT